MELGARVMLSAVLEPDADRDGYGDETQDACPSDPATHLSPCPAPPSTGTSPTTSVDKTPPALSIGARSARLSRSGAIAFTVRSSEDASGTAGGTIGLPKRAKVVRFTRARVALTAGRATRVVLKLSKRNAREVRRALARGARLTANVTLVVHDAAGNGSARRLRLKLRR